MYYITILSIDIGEIILLLLTCRYHCNVYIHVKKVQRCRIIVILSLFKSCINLVDQNIPVPMFYSVNTSTGATQCLSTNNIVLQLEKKKTKTY